MPCSYVAGDSGSGGILIKQGGQIDYTPANEADFQQGLTFENTGSGHAFSIGYGQGGVLKFSYFDNASTYSEIAQMKPSGDFHPKGSVVLPAGEGISFAANAHASGMTSEVLDDYEEGTWTPSLRNGTTAMTVTWHYGPMAVYTKIGRQVTFQLAGKLSALSGTGTGEFRVFGLPFQPASTGGYQEYRVNFIAGNNVTVADSSRLFGFIRDSGNDVGTRILDGGDTVFASNQIDADTFFSIYGTYFTA